MLSLALLAGAAFGIAAISETSGIALSHAGAKAAGAVETATQEFISVSTAHNRKLKLEMLLNILKFAGWLGGLSGVWSAIHHWLRHF